MRRSRPLARHVLITTDSFPYGYRRWVTLSFIVYCFRGAFSGIVKGSSATQAEKVTDTGDANWAVEDVVV